MWSAQGWRRSVCSVLMWNIIATFITCRSTQQVGLRIMKRWAVIVRHYALRLISSFLPFFLSDLSLTHVFVLSSFVVFPVHLLSLVSEPTAIIRSLSSQMEVTVWWPFSSKGSSDSGSDRVRGLYRKYYDPDMTETFNGEVLILLCCQCRTDWLLLHIFTVFHLWAFYFSWLRLQMRRRSLCIHWC